MLQTPRVMGAAFRLPEVCEVREVAALHGALSTAAASAGDQLLCVDAREVSRIDTAGAQCLVVFARTQPATWRLSAPLRARLEALGVLALFQEEPAV